MTTPISPDALASRLKHATSLHQAGRLAEAEAIYREILAARPDDAETLHLLGVVHQQRGEHEPASRLIQRSILGDPSRPAPHSNLGIVLHRLGRLDAALESLDAAIRIKPAYPQALTNRGNVLRDLGRLDEALASHRAALALSPAQPEILLNLATSLRESRRPEEALAIYAQLLQAAPGNAQALVSRGNVLRELQRQQDALESYDLVLARDPGSVAALVGRGNALQSLKRHEEALASYQRMLELDPAHFEVLNNIGAVLRDLKRYGDAAESFRVLATARPDADYADSNWLHSQLYCCDWSRYDSAVAAIGAHVLAGDRADVPFSFLAISDSAEAQLHCARRYAADNYARMPLLPPAIRAARRGRIHIAYLSGDFHNHAVSFLMAGLFERHDRERFSVTAISYGPDADDGMRKRLRPAFDEFMDVRSLSDQEVAELIREREVDIAIDLSGYTVGNRAGILARRPAPLQVNYLGYPGTMGASHIDYLVADARLVPPDHERWYSEAVITLPDSYQVNDDRRTISPRAFTRAEAGLPDAGFVFCCFNNNYKISPAVFATWMRLLRQVPGSVLWLLDDNEDARRNLRSEANRAGIAPTRLVFAPRMPPDEHLARHRLADLFLDTTPYNAHTTASDALWAGLPVITCPGNAFASRVATSLLDAVGLPELVAGDLQGYEQLGLQLACSPAMLAGFRSRIVNRETTALFNTDRFRRHLESAFETIWDRHLRGEAPSRLRVPPHA